jgi:hypothetical protein
VSLRIVVLQHEPETGLGAFATVLDRAQVEYEIVESGNRTSEVVRSSGVRFPPSSMPAPRVGALMA